MVARDSPESNLAPVRAMVGDGDSTVHEGCSLSLAGSTAMPRVNVLGSLVEGVILSWGWRRRAIAFVSGAVGALALPPFSLFVAHRRAADDRGLADRRRSRTAAPDGR